MPAIRIFPNSDFLAYRGDHSHIILPDNPIATVKLPDMRTPEHALSMAYHLSQHLESPWWLNSEVQLHVRSTSVGDVLSDADDNRFVVESLGFQPYTPLPQRLAWQEAGPGNIVGSPDSGEYVIIARRLERKWRARRLAEAIPQAMVWADGHRYWAVVVPLLK
ncbi:MAG: hypothetical protein V9G20_01495 [Candidatus Promineifilaceae bacterium]